MTSRLVAQGLVKAYRRRRVVDGVHFDVRQGEVVGLLGPNGAGKTTSFYLVLGLASLDAGSVTLDGEDLTHLRLHHRTRRGIGYLPPEASIFRKLSVRENFLAVLELDRRNDRHVRAKKAAALIEEFGLQHVANSRGDTLSCVERRRV